MTSTSQTISHSLDCSSNPTESMSILHDRDWMTMTIVLQCTCRPRRCAMVALTAGSDASPAAAAASVNAATSVAASASKAAIAACRWGETCALMLRQDGPQDSSINVLQQ